MSRVKAGDTKPELVIRKGLFKKGFRYLLHDKRLPGKPDLVFPKYNAVIFINGCFWHQHDCPAFTWPKKNKNFWRKKLSRNKELDGLNCEKLKAGGWYVLTVWECALKGTAKLGRDTLINRISLWLVSEACDLEIRGHIQSGSETTIRVKSLAL